MDELLHKKVVHAAWMVLHLVSERGHLLRTPAVNGREVLLRVGVAVILQLQLRVRRDDSQLLQVLFWQGGTPRDSPSYQELERHSVNRLNTARSNIYHPLVNIGQIA